MSGNVYKSASQGQVSRVIPDLIRYRGLLRDLVSKGLRARFRNAAMGLVWAALQPLLMTLVLTFVFTLLFNAGGRGGVRQTALDILSKIIFWQFFSASLLAGVHSILYDQELVKKNYFPREVLPLSALGQTVVNLAVGLLVFVAAHIFLTGTAPALTAVFVPVVFAIELTLIVGLVLLFGALNVFYQDVGFFVEVALTFGFYASPVLYAYEDVPRLAQAADNPVIRLLARAYPANPMAGILTAYQDALVDGAAPAWSSLAWPAVCAGAVLVLGVTVFRRLSPYFADRL